MTKRNFDRSKDKDGDDNPLNDSRVIEHAFSKEGKYSATAQPRLVKDVVVQRPSPKKLELVQFQELKFYDAKTKNKFTMRADFNLSSLLVVGEIEDKELSATEKKKLREEAANIGSLCSPLEKICCNYYKCLVLKM